MQLRKHVLETVGKLLDKGIAELHSGIGKIQIDLPIAYDVFQGTIRRCLPTEYETIRFVETNLDNVSTVFNLTAWQLPIVGCIELCKVHKEVTKLIARNPYEFRPFVVLQKRVEGRDQKTYRVDLPCQLVPETSARAPIEVSDDELKRFGLDNLDDNSNCEKVLQVRALKQAEFDERSSQRFEYVVDQLLNRIKLDGSFKHIGWSIGDLEEQQFASSKELPSVDFRHVRTFDILMQRFSEDELQDLCFRLSVPWGELPGQTITAKARGIIEWFVRRDKLNALHEGIIWFRPDIREALNKIGSS